MLVTQFLSTALKKIGISGKKTTALMNHFSPATAGLSSSAHFDSSAHGAK
jgi:hypothetical protein